MSKRPSPLPLVVATWIGACGLGMWQLLAHATSPGAIGIMPQRLPATTAAALHWSGERGLLVVAAHPQCPCLPSTFDALAHALSDNPDVDLRVLVYQPSVLPEAWDEQAFRTLADGLPAGTAVVDRDALLARALGAQTSGHVSLYAQSGQLTFAGGITASRGHVGNNAAARALRQVLGNPARAATTIRTAVFGCPLTCDSDPPCDACRQSDATR